MGALGFDVWSLVIGFGAGILAVLIILAVRTKRVREHLGGPPAGLKAVAEARWEKGEAAASTIAEQIAEMANRELADHPGRPKVRIDFGTAVDGSLEIWVGSDRYRSVGDIPDVGVREAVARAVAKFNR